MRKILASMGAIGFVLLSSGACDGDDDYLSDDGSSSGTVSSSSGAGSSSGGRDASVSSSSGSSGRDSGVCPAGQELCGGACVTLATDRLNCGTCGTACAAGEICDGNGTCAVSCQAGLVACDGTCIDPETNRAFCGAAGDCAGTNAGVACGAGSLCDGNGGCSTSCQAGFVLCDGTCVDPTTSRAFCGASGNCQEANAGVACGAGTLCDGAGSCAVSCQAGLVLCGGNCVDPTTSPAFCGATGDCQAANAGAVCGAGTQCDGNGTCAVSCQPGLVLCNGSCIDPTTSRSFCGASEDCQGDNGGIECGAGTQCDGNGACAVSCQPGLVLCGGTCIDPTTSRNFCGATGDCAAANAGVACNAGSICNGNGACAVSCQAGLVLCGGTCVDPESSRSFCGATGDCEGLNAGVACAAGELCDGNGACAPSCQAGLVLCGGTCVDPDTSASFCGAAGDCLGLNAGTACAAGSRCDGNGSCQVSCQAGLVLCGGNCVDPSTSRTFCGATADCQGANDGNVCAAGTICNGAGACTTTCQAGLLTCGGTCTDPSTSRTYCGATGNCAGANDGTVCAANEACFNGACAALVRSTFVGVQSNVPAANVIGWTPCYADRYDNRLTSLASIQASCNQANLMMACRPVGSTTYTLLAHAPRADVLFETGMSNTPHDANGTGWYYSNSWSWGFAPQGAAINRSSCDYGNTGARLCWHTSGGNISSGYRCGDNELFDGDWERVVLQAP